MAGSRPKAGQPSVRGQVASGNDPHAPTTTERLRDEAELLERWQTHAMRKLLEQAREPATTDHDLDAATAALARIPHTTALEALESNRNLVAMLTGAAMVVRVMTPQASKPLVLKDVWPTALLLERPSSGAGWSLADCWVACLASGAMFVQECYLCDRSVTSRWWLC